MTRTAFYTSLRTRLGPFSQSQVEGLERILDEAERRKTPLRWLAYMLATAWHETARKMQPVREGGSESYLKSKPYYPWVGEGLVQVTWETNARKFGATKPGDCMSWPVALRALFDGMEKGLFTGKCLFDYIGVLGHADYRNARRIVNGLDKADLIAGYAETFENALKLAGWGEAEPLPAPAVPEPAQPPPPVQVVELPPEPAPAATGFWAWLKGIFG
jgi:putative chitinase